MDELPFRLCGYEPGRYLGCKWCTGDGCVACDGEAKKEAARLQEEYERQFPYGPICVSIPLDKIKDASGAIGGDALIKAFSNGGGGSSEVFGNLERLGFGKPRPISDESSM